MLQLALGVFHSLIDHLFSLGSSARKSLPQNFERRNVDKDKVALKPTAMDFLAALKVDFQDGNLWIL